MSKVEELVGKRGGQAPAKGEKTIEKLIGLFIYLAGLVVLIPQSLRNIISSDQMREYEKYIDFVQNGGWRMIDINQRDYTNLAYFTTAIPAYIQRLFDFSNPELMFRVFPMVFFALVPVFTYLIARKFLSVGQSVLAALFVMTHYYFLVNPFLGRVVVGWAFLAVFLYALIYRKWWLAGISSFALVFTHYGAAAIALVIAAVLFVYFLAKGYLDYGAITGGLVLLAAGGVWVLWVGQFNWLSIVSTWKDYPREYVTSVMIGLEFPFSHWLQYVLWALAWVVFLLIVFGLLSFWKSKEDGLKVIAVVCVALVAVTLAVPQLSNIYGLARVYYSGLPVLAGFFVYGLTKLSALTPISFYWLVPLIIFHPNISPF